jgi:hypothetical protein
MQYHQWTAVGRSHRLNTKSLQLVEDAVVAPVEVMVQPLDAVVGVLLKAVN